MPEGGEGLAPREALEGQSYLLSEGFAGVQENSPSFALVLGADKPQYALGSIGLPEAKVEEFKQMLQNLQDQLKNEGFVGMMLDFTLKEGQEFDEKALQQLLELEIVRGVLEENVDEKVYSKESPYASFSLVLVDSSGKLRAYCKNRRLVAVDNKGNVTTIVEEGGKNEGNYQGDIPGLREGGVKILAVDSELSNKEIEDILSTEGREKGVKEIGGELLKHKYEGDKEPSVVSGAQVEKGEEEKPKEGKEVERLKRAIEERQTHKFPYFVDLGEYITIKELHKYPNVQEGYNIAGSLIEAAKGYIQRKQGETEEEYTLRVAKQLAEKLRWWGDSIDEGGPLVELIIENVDPGGLAPFVLMGLEAHIIQNQMERNRREYEEHMSLLRGRERRRVKTEVTYQGGAYLEGGLDDVFELVEEEGRRKRRMKEMPKKDLYAFAIVADNLLDVEDLIDLEKTGDDEKAKTFRDKMDDLLKTIRDKNATWEEKTQASMKLVGLRRRFYELVERALKEYISSSGNIDIIGTRLNAGASTHDKVILNMINKLAEMSRKVRKEGIGSVLNNETWRGAHLGEMEGLFESDTPNLFTYALKGADLMLRRISYVPEGVEPVDDKIYYKKFVQGGEGLKKVTSARKESLPEREKGERSKQKEEPPGLKPAEVAVEAPSEQEKKKEEREAVEPPPPAPAKGETQPQKELEPQPVPKELEPPPEPSPAPQPEQLPPQEFNIVFAVDPTQISKEVNAGVDFQMRLQQEEDGGLLSLPRKIIKGFWQRTLAEPVFRERERRWRLRVMEKTGLTHLPNELVKRALEEGQERRKQHGFFRRHIVDRVRNAFASVFGFHTVEQVEAQEWLEKQVEAAKGGGKPEDALVREVLEGSFKEREALAERYERAEEMLNREISPGTRERLEHGEYIRRVNEQADKILKERFVEIFGDYLASGEERKKREAMAKLENYLRGRGNNSLAEDLKEAGIDPRVAEILSSRFAVIGSNMAKVADILRENAQTYFGESSVDKSAWEKAILGTEKEEPKVNLKFYVVTNAELSFGGPEERGKLRERVLDKLRLRREEERVPFVAGTGVIDKFVGRYGTRLLASLGVNELTAAAIAGYLASTLGSLTPTSSQKAKLLAGFAAPVVGVGVAGVTLPFSPVFAGAAAAGAFAALRERRRIKEQVKAVERERSFGVDLSQQSKGFLAKLLGISTRKELERYTVDQKKITEIIGQVKDLFEEVKGEEGRTVGLKLKESIDSEALHNAIASLAEYEARLRLARETGRRFLIFDGQLSESQQMAFLQNLKIELLTRLYRNPQIINVSSPEEVRNWFSTLVDLYAYNLRSGEQNLALILYKTGHQVSEEEKARFEPYLKNLVEKEKSLRARNRALNWFRTRRSIRRGLTVFATGIAVGEAVQELKHLALGEEPGILGWVRDRYFPQQPKVSAPQPAAPQPPGVKPAGFEVVVEPNKGIKGIVEVDANNNGLVDQVKIELGGGKSEVINLDGEYDLSNPFGQQEVLHKVKEELLQEYKDKLDVTEVNLTIESSQTVLNEKIGDTELIVNGLEWLRFVKSGDEITGVEIIDPSNEQNILGEYSFEEPIQLDGNVAEELKEKLAELGFKVSENREGLYEYKPSNEVFEKLVHKVARREWYTYDTPDSDFNELLLKTYALEDGKVVIDFSEMGKSSAHGLPEIDVGQVIKSSDYQSGKDLDHVFGIYISPKGEMNEGILIPDGVDGEWDGRVVLDPKSERVIELGGVKIKEKELYKLLVNGKALRNALEDERALKVSLKGLGRAKDIATELIGHPYVWRVKGREGFISVGWLRKVNGEERFASFATIRAKSDLYEYVIRLERGEQVTLKIEKPPFTSWIQKLRVEVEEEAQLPTPPPELKRVPEERNYTALNIPLLYRSYPEFAGATRGRTPSYPQVIKSAPATVKTSSQSSSQSTPVRREESGASVILEEVLKLAKEDLSDKEKKVYDELESIIRQLREALGKGEESIKEIKQQLIEKVEEILSRVGKEVDQEEVNKIVEEIIRRLEIKNNV